MKTCQLQIYKWNNSDCGRLNTCVVVYTCMQTLLKHALCFFSLEQILKASVELLCSTKSRQLNTHDIVALGQTVLDSGQLINSEKHDLRALVGRWMQKSGYTSSELKYPDAWCPLLVPELIISEVQYRQAIKTAVALFRLLDKILCHKTIYF